MKINSFMLSKTNLEIKFLKAQITETASHMAYKDKSNRIYSDLHK